MFDINTHQAWEPGKPFGPHAISEWFQNDQSFTVTTN